MRHIGGQAFEQAIAGFAPSYRFVGYGSDEINDISPYFLADALHKTQFVRLAKGLREFRIVGSYWTALLQYGFGPIRDGKEIFVGIGPNERFDRGASHQLVDLVESMSLSELHPFPVDGYEKLHMLAHVMRVPTIWKEKWVWEPNRILVVTPYLGRRVVEFALSVPNEIRWGLRPRKPLHRRAFRDLLPDSVLNGPETINDVRVQQSFKARRRTIEELVQNSRMVEMGYADRDKIQDITGKGADGRFA